MGIRYVPKRRLRHLAAARGAPRLSLCLPTFRSGERVREGPIRLKNLLVDARERAGAMGLDKRAVEAAVAQVSELIGERDFWNQQGEGLALYASPDEIEAFRVPVPVDELAFVGDRYCVRPLLPAVVEDASFLVLALSQRDVRLVECTRDDAAELDRGDLPASIADALGADWEPRSVQFHTGTPATGTGRRSAVFHGQGGGRDDAKDEIRRFLQIVDDGLTGRIDDRSTPLVVAAVDYLIPLFHAVSSYPGLVEGGVPGSPDELDAPTLRDRALTLVEPWLDSARRRAVDRFAGAVHGGRAALGVTEVLRAAAESRVETLLVRAGETAWGRFDQDAGEIEIRERREATDDDLVDRAVSLALASGGTIHAVGPGELPDGLAVGAVLYY